MSQNDSDRRLAIVFVDYRALLRQFDLGRQLREKIGSAEPFLMVVEELDIPDDAQIVSVHTDDPRDGFAVILRSESFEPVPRGRLLPHLGELHERIATFRVVSEVGRGGTT